MTGSDGQTTVGGFFAMAQYTFVPGVAVTIARSYWDYGIQSSTSGDTATGLELTPSGNLVIRLLYEDKRDVPYFIGQMPTQMPSTHLRHIFSVQAVARF
jgi:hypothetical protein